MEPISKRFRAAVAAFVQAEGIPLITFHPGERKEAIAAAHRARFPRDEGIVFVGRAQEKTPVLRTEKRRHPQTGQTYPWLVRSTAMITHFYFYGVDRDFGPFFVKFGTYFPYTGKLCLNGHEYVKQQLTRAGIAFEALDNGLLSCAAPCRAQASCDGLSAARIDALARKWLARLPHPYTAADRKAGYRYDVSILQAEFALTQVLDQPVTGRVIFEEVIRENLDVGRPDQVQLIFDRRVTRRTPGRFRPRVLTEGVTPSLHVDYKRSRIEQYHKEGRALRTETTINDARDFGVGKRLKNLPALREIGLPRQPPAAPGRTAHARLRDRRGRVPRGDHPTGGRRATGRGAPLHRPAPPGALERPGGLPAAPRGFRQPRPARHARAPVGRRARHTDLGQPDLPTPPLAPPRPHCADRRDAPLSRHRRRPADRTLLHAHLFARTYARLLRPGLAHVLPRAPTPGSPLRRAFDALETAMDRWCAEAKLAA